MYKDHVRMTVGGMPAMVPVEYAKKVQRKQDLVADVKRLQAGINACTGFGQTLLQEQLLKTMGKIIRLRRSIPPCVKFI